jgi:hypothetical protein
MEFNKPSQLNGVILKDELKAVQIIVDEVRVSGNSLILEIADKDKSKAEQVISDHKGEDIVDPKIALRASALAKLAALGLSADEIAAL